MAINLNKHKNDLLKAWEEVHDPQSSNNWVVFGYDGKTYELKVVEKGDGGLDEMVDELSGGKILYAAVRVEDPNTNLPKLVFVNWQGEGVPTSVKGTCASHWRDVTAFFKGAHVTVQARNEDDLDEQSVMDKVKKSSGANYGFHKEKPKPIVNPSGPVGTNYKRVNPMAEINIASRDKFWMEQEKEEQKRRNEEKAKLDQLRVDDEKNRKAREAKEQAAREHFVKERSLSIEQQRIAAKKELDRRKNEERKRYEETLKEANLDDQEFRNRSESLRKQRLMEAQELIRERKKSFGEVNPRQTFESSTRKAPPPVQQKRKPADRQTLNQEDVAASNGSREQGRREPPPPQPKPKRPSQTHPIAEETPKSANEVPLNVVHRVPEPEPQQESKPLPEPEPQLEPQPKLIPKQEPAQAPEPVFVETHDTRQVAQQDLYDVVPDIPPTQQPAKGDIYEEVPEDVLAQPQEKPQDSQEIYETIEDLPPQGVTNAQTVAPQNQGMVARAVFDYQAADDTEVTFDPGDIITEIDQVDQGWWKGRVPNGMYGLFPANYVEIISTEQQMPTVKNGPVEEPVKESADEGLVAKALFDYQAADESEISFDPGQIITHIEQVDEGWWKGRGPSGHFGLFPANYVEIVKSTEQSVQDTPSAMNTIESNGPSAKAVYDYQAADDTEISFDPGDIITNIDQIDEGWWKGVGPEGRIGLFPANYVELIS